VDQNISIETEYNNSIRINSLVRNGTDRLAEGEIQSWIDLVCLAELTYVR